MTSVSIPQTYYPSPTPANRITEIWEDYKRGLYSPREMLAAQNAELLPCVAHLNRPGYIIVDDQPRCLECWERLRGGRS